MTALAEPTGTAPPTEPLTVADLALVFKALGDPARLQLLSMIASAAGGEVTVCDLKPAFYLTAATISHHLKLLREAGLIDGRRQGTWVYYRAIPQRLQQVSTLLSRSSHTGLAVTGCSPVDQ
ncbi:ArsR/SmtB family transcription factor [Allorhizocola rhizosphaerae]|uniref:ArsR/SmtB family transcription factor n=1 Tax=Allorhizocola rhizosphaerae TaxID=1872709 RepID=UPI000E3E8EA9|nr:metalloregulator ArsR/SmtB family transcription factor [Allorhizocola rhizosphaerae]